MFKLCLLRLLVLAGVASSVEVNARADVDVLTGNMTSISVSRFIGSFSEFDSNITHNFIASYNPGIIVDETWVVSNSNADFFVDSIKGEWEFKGTIGPELVQLHGTKECGEVPCGILGRLDKPILKSYDVSGTVGWTS